MSFQTTIQLMLLTDHNSQNYISNSIQIKLTLWPIIYWSSMICTTSCLQEQRCYSFNCSITNKQNLLTDRMFVYQYPVIKRPIKRWYDFWWFLVPIMHAYMNYCRTEVMIIHIYISVIRTKALTRYMLGSIIGTNVLIVQQGCWIHN